MSTLSANMLDFISQIKKSDAQVSTHKPTSDPLKVREIADPELRKILSMVTINTESSPVGTYKYAGFKYPGDIDLFEKIRLDKSRKDFIDFVSKRIQAIIRSIVLSQEIYYVEIKMGEDKELDIDSTALKANPKAVVEAYLRKAYSNGYVTKEEVQEVSKALFKYLKSQDPADFDSMDKKIREFRMLRWKSSEIARGRKKLRGNGRQISIQDALNMPVVTKLDTLAWNSNRFIELTNFFYFELGKEGDNTNVTVISQPFADYMESLMGDIKKYAGCKEYPRDSLKMLKRMFIKDVLMYKSSNDPKLMRDMDEILDVVNRAPGALSQIKADFEALETVATVLNNVDLNKVNLMVNGMGKRFSNNNENTELFRDFSDMENTLFTMYVEYLEKGKDSLLYSQFMEKIMDYVDKWISALKKIITKETDAILADKYPDLGYRCGVHGGR